MRIIRSPKAMQRQALEWRREGIRVGFVPTMGSLHEGHLSLMRKARDLVGETGVLAVSVYVNPTQFGPREDFNAYPRPLRRDVRLCRETGVDVLFLPTDASMYPGRERGDYSVYVEETALSKAMEGASRPTHFRGVATVVAKLFHLLFPDVAVFGGKDYQQAMVVRRMTEQLNFPVRIVVAPTVRERDRVAMSSRNVYLTGEQRAQAPILWEMIQEARRRIRSSRDPLTASQLKRSLARRMEKAPLAKLDYVEFFDPISLEPVRRVAKGAHMALAVHFGSTRLIDNGRL